MHGEIRIGSLSGKVTFQLNPRERVRRYRVKRRDFRSRKWQLRHGRIWDRLDWKRHKEVGLLGIQSHVGSHQSFLWRGETQKTVAGNS